MKIYFATSNKQKIITAQQSVKNLGVEIEQIEMEFIEGRAEDPKEIAIEKASQAYEKLKKPVIVEDAGFFIDALGGFPMTHVKFSLRTLGIEKILKMMEGEENRSVRWPMTLVYMHGENQLETFTYVHEGRLTEDVRPIVFECWSDYWRIYIANENNPKNMALSEMTREDLNFHYEHFEKKNHYVQFAEWLKSHDAAKK